MYLESNVLLLMLGLLLIIAVSLEPKENVGWT
jgi:hypothetical protein